MQGALDSQRLQGFKDRYRLFEDPTIPKYTQPVSFGRMYLLTYFPRGVQIFVRISLFLGFGRTLLPCPPRAVHKLLPVNARRAI